jgi:hypothetical protein
MKINRDENVDHKKTQLGDLMLATRFGWSPKSIPLFPVSIAHYSAQQIRMLI